MGEFYKNNKYSFIIIAGLVGYFLLMRVIGLHENQGLRGLNALIMFAGLNLAMKNKVKQEGADNYVGNFFYGLKTGVFAVIGFCVLSFFYLSFVEPSLIESVGTSKIWGHNLTVTELTFALLIEGWASVIVINLLVLQQYKNILEVGDKVKQKVKDKVEKVSKGGKQHIPH